MKSNLFLAISAACLALVSCKKEEPVVETPAPETAPSSPPAAVPVPEQEFKIAEEEPAENEATRTPGQRLDRAIEKTEQGLDTAKEKTEEGLRKAAEKTGEFLRRTGETIERKAGE